MVQAKQKNEVYKCSVCGNIVEVLHVGGGELVCCGKPMELMDEKGKAEEGNEKPADAKAVEDKHVPVIEKTGAGVKVRVGSVPHPMEDAHYIEWIELIVEDERRVCRKNLKPGDVPEAEFKTQSDSLTARDYCNVHGLWKS